MTMTCLEQTSLIQGKVILSYLLLYYYYYFIWLDVAWLYSIWIEISKQGIFWSTYRAYLHLSLYAFLLTRLLSNVLKLFHLHLAT